MTETEEKAKFMKKPTELANSSRQYIERLWKIGINVSKLGASIASFFSSIFYTITKAIIRLVGFSKGIRELYLSRFMFFPPFDLPVSRIAPSVEGYFPTEMTRANVSFLFNVTVARKIATQLARRVTVKAPKQVLSPRPAHLPKAQFVEETIEERVEEPERTVPHIVADLHSRFESKLSPSIKSIASALQEYGRPAISLTPLLAMPEPSFMGPERLKGPPSHPLAAPPEKETPPIGLLEKAEASIFGVPSLPEKFKVKTPPLVLMPFLGLGQEATFTKLPITTPKPPVLISARGLTPDTVSSWEYAAKLPSLVLKREIPILKRMAAFPFILPKKPPLPSAKPTYRYPTPTPTPTQISRSLEEVSPSLTSWIYGISEVLRGTSLSLSAVPVAASTAEKVVTEALVQPVSSFEAPSTPIVSPRSTSSRPETGAEVEAFRLPAVVASLVVALSQRFPLLFTEPTIGETYGATFEVTGVTPEAAPTQRRMPEMKTFSKLPTVIALAAAESLIAQRLHREFSALTKEIQVARSSYGEKVSELGVFRPIRTPMLGKLAAAAPALPSTIEPFPHLTTSLPPPITRTSPVGPTIQNTFNITVSAESKEEDLRDLERKISKILSEQVRRYYGSPRI